MGSRRQSREAALQMLYLCDISTLPPLAAIESLLPSFNLPDDSRRFAESLFNGAWSRRADSDELIMRYAQNWEMSRMAAIDRNILRLAAYEIVDMPDTPVNVIIDEAVEIAKRYSTSESSKFVNGILDKLKASRKT